MSAEFHSLRDDCFGRPLDTSERRKIHLACHNTVRSFRRASLSFLLKHFNTSNSSHSHPLLPPLISFDSNLINAPVAVISTSYIRTCSHQRTPVAVAIVAGTTKLHDTARLLSLFHSTSSPPHLFISFYHQHKSLP